MGPSREDRHECYVAKARAELASLAERGVLMAGNAFSSILLVKGEPTAEERDGGAPFAGEDGTALRAALEPRCRRWDMPPRTGRGWPSGTREARTWTLPC